MSRCGCAGIPVWLLRLFDRVLVDKHVRLAMTPDVEFERDHCLEESCVYSFAGRDHGLDILDSRIEGEGVPDEDVQVFGTSVCEIDGDLACAVIGMTDD